MTAESPALRRIAVVRNRRGLHARASARFVKTAERFDVEIDVAHNGATVSGRSIMGLLMLAAGPGSALEISARGPEAEAALAALAALVSDRFGEE